MSRMVFKKHEVKRYILEFKHSLGLNWDELGKEVSLSSRTLRDWKNGLLLPSKQKVELFEKLSGLKAPNPIEVREEFWSGGVYGHKAALARIKNMVRRVRQKEDVREG